ncbi:Rieske 2Fe-2S domain-containing protein [Candidatus Chloroploca sp. M-50]|uniref:Rieske 2Fe-2S domain-containing protein n=2 Tax=Candidatus Chloroploca mongolica TaxID=2528176 RepID=A0ABS4D542_9CHLR|nr:Rieske 2Fe-2S domain-containing protein [Candidatus Chloroploca mongolica]
MAGEWVEIGEANQLAPGQLIYAAIEGLPVTVANVDGTLYAFSDACRHEGGPLSAGVLIGATITCPWHGWAYDVRTGKSLVPPVGLRLATYPVRICDDTIWIEIDWEQ